MFASNPSLQSDALQVRVVIPAIDQAATLERALDALRNQVDRTGRPLEAQCFDVTVLADTGNDETASIIRDYADRHPVFPLHLQEQSLPRAQANPGAARRALFDDACARFEADGHEGIVASTDADTIVAPDWLAATLAEFAKGADAVGGRIALSAEDLADLPPEQRHLYLQDTGYRILLAELGAAVDPRPCDPSPCHHQHFGASLAVRSSVYRFATSLPDVRSQGGLTIFEALERIDARVRHSPWVRVTASARRSACGPLGCSTQPVEWAATPRGEYRMVVEPVERSLQRLQLRHELNDRWRQRHARADLVRGARMDAFVTFGTFLASVRPEIEHFLDDTVGNEPVPLDRAIGDLRIALATYR
jgi:hypothetical protein